MAVTVVPWRRFDNTDFLQVGCQPTTLAKGQHMDVPISFTPRHAQKYQANVALRVLGGMYTHEISISGEAVPLKLELVDAKQRHISLGSVVLGSKTQRKTSVSKQPASIGATCINRRMHR